MNKKYTVFVSSTYEDLKEERQEVIRALLEIDCIPCAMELFPAADEEIFEFIKSILDDCDYYVLILGGKYGSMNSAGISYTELEFKYALEHNIPIISFIYNNTETLPNFKCEHDIDTINKLKNFKILAQQKFCKKWTNKEQLAGLVSRSMIQLIKKHPSIGWVRGNCVSNEETLIKLTELYEENRKLKNNNNQEIPFDALSSGQDTINVDFKIYNGVETKFEVDNFSIKMSWDDILKQIGLLLIEEKSQIWIEDSMCEIGTQKYFELLNDTEKILYFKKNQYMKISIHSIGKILVQFIALGYISVNHPNHNNDYELSHESTYVLTERGRNALIRLTAIRV